MNNKLIKAAGAAAMIATPSLAKADSWSLGVGGNIGASMFGGVKFIEASNADASAKAKFKELGGESVFSIPWAFGALGGMEFGDEENGYTFGFELFAGFSAWSKAMEGKKKDVEFSRLETSARDALILASKGKDSAEKESNAKKAYDATPAYKYKDMGILVDVLGKISFVYFDAGNLFFKLGPSMRLGFNAKFVDSDDKQIVKKAAAKEESSSGGGSSSSGGGSAPTPSAEAKENSDDKDDFLKSFDIAIKGAFGADFMNKAISVAIEGRFWFLDHFKESDKFKKHFSSFGVEKMEVKGGFDLTLGLGINIVPLIIGE